MGLTPDERERFLRLEERVNSLDSDVRELLGEDRESVVKVVELLAKRRSLRAPGAVEGWSRRQVTWAVGATVATLCTVAAAVLARACGV